MQVGHNDFLAVRGRTSGYFFLVNGGEKGSGMSVEISKLCVLPYRGKGCTDKPTEATANFIASLLRIY